MRIRWMRCCYTSPAGPGGIFPSRCAAAGRRRAHVVPGDRVPLGATATGWYPRDRGAMGHGRTGRRGQASPAGGRAGDTGATIASGRGRSAWAGMSGAALLASRSLHLIGIVTARGTAATGWTLSPSTSRSQLQPDDRRDPVAGHVRSWPWPLSLTGFGCWRRGYRRWTAKSALRRCWSTPLPCSRSTARRWARAARTGARRVPAPAVRTRGAALDPGRSTDTDLPIFTRTRGRRHCCAGRAASTAMGQGRGARSAARVWGNWPGSVCSGGLVCWFGCGWGWELVVGAGTVGGFAADPAQVDDGECG